MLVEYFYWHYVAAPNWLLKVIWNMQRALVQLFSVKLMLRTLLAHWHKDSMPFHGGTLEQLGMSVLWNIVSRIAGLLVRTGVLILWLATETLFWGVIVLLIPLFLAWPLLVIIGLAASFSLLAT